MQFQALLVRIMALDVRSVIMILIEYFVDYAKKFVFNKSLV